MPEQHGGRYFLDAHGELTEISRERYVDERKADQRAVAVADMAFSTVAVAAALSWRRRPSPPADGAPAPPQPPGPGAFAA